MKIIGHSSEGYICEISKAEMQLATGVGEPWDSRNRGHKVGQIVDVPKIAEHMRNMEYTAKDRAKAAETLRACANIIETVPVAFVAPPEEKPAPSAIQKAAAELRAELE